MASTSVRTAAKARLVELLTQRLPDVQVAYGWPGEDLKDEAIFLAGDIKGTRSVRDLRSGRKARDDSFTVDVHFMAGKPGQSAQQADERVEQLVNELDNILADNQQLALDGNPLDGIQWAALFESTVESTLVVIPAEGWGAMATATVQVKTILT